jgi:hypothetical protein
LTSILGFCLLPFPFFHFLPILPFWAWLSTRECRPTRHRGLIRVRVTHITGVESHVVCTSSRENRESSAISTFFFFHGCVQGRRIEFENLPDSTFIFYKYVGKEILKVNQENRDPPWHF